MLLMHVQETRVLGPGQPDKELLSTMFTLFNNLFSLLYIPFSGKKKNSNLCTLIDLYLKTDANVHTVEMHLSTSNMDG